MASLPYSQVPQHEGGGSVVTQGVPVQPQPSGTSICDRVKEPVATCCSCLTLRQGVIIIASLNILGGLLSLFGAVGFGFLISHWDFIMQQMKENAESQGNWNLVFRQTVPTFLSPVSQWLNYGTSNLADDYSRLLQLENYRQSGYGFLFKMSWPGSVEESNIWFQASNPTVFTDVVHGYAAVSVPFKDRWSGLSLSTHPERTLIDGCVQSNWWYAIGTAADYQDFGGPNSGIPGPYNIMANQVELYVWEGTIANTECVITDPGYYCTKEGPQILCEEGFYCPGGMLGPIEPCYDGSSCPAGSVEDEMPPEEEMEKVHQVLPVLQMIAIVLGVFQIVIAMIGMHGALARNKTTSKYYSIILILCTVIVALMSLGGVLEFIVNVGITGYCTKVAWSWYLSLMRDENARRVDTYSSYQPVMLPPGEGQPSRPPAVV